MATSDNSVMVALAELRGIEADRIATERKAAEQARAARERADAAARTEREREREAIREREASALRVAEAEARLRVGAELEAREADADRRLEVLRAELEMIRADRERMHQSILDRTAGEGFAVATPSSRPWVAVSCLSAAVAIAMGAWAIHVESRARDGVGPAAAPHREIVESGIPVSSAAALEPAVVAPTAGDDGAAEGQGNGDGRADVRTPSGPARPGGTRAGGGSARPPNRQPTHADPLGDLDRCGDDPTCGAVAP